MSDNITLNKRTFFSTLLIICLLSILFTGVFMINAQSDITITEESFRETSSFVFWVSDGVYYAKNGETGQVTSSTNASYLLNNAIDDVDDNGGGLIHVTNGIYSITNLIDFPRTDVTIEGEGYGTVLKWTGAASGYLMGNDADRPVYQSGITNIRLDGNSDNIANVSPLSLHSLQTSNINNLWVSNFADKPAISIVADATDGVWTNNTVHNNFGSLFFENGRVCLYMFGLTGVVTNNYFAYIYGWNVTERGIVFYNQTDNNYFGNVQLFLTANNAIGVLYNDEVPESSNHAVYANNFYGLIVDNYGESTGQYGVYINYAYDIKIENLYYSGTLTPIADAYGHSYWIYDTYNKTLYTKGQDTFQLNGTIDLSQNEIQNAVFHSGSTPPVSPVEGQWFYDTDDHTLYVWNSTAWNGILGEGGVTDHGALTGLDDDDHSQYILDTGDSMGGDLNMTQHEITDFVVDSRSTAPTSPVVGQMYYDTDDNILYVWNSTAWHELCEATGGGDALFSDDFTDTELIDEELTGWGEHYIYLPETINFTESVYSSSPRCLYVTGDGDPTPTEVIKSYNITEYWGKASYYFASDFLMESPTNNWTSLGDACFEYVDEQNTLYIEYGIWDENLQFNMGVSIVEDGVYDDIAFHSGYYYFSREVWYEIKYHIVRSVTAGVVEVWINDEQIIDWSNIRTKNSIDDFNWIPIKHYCQSDMNETTIYYDDVTIALTEGGLD